jgi:hypothetical protein
MSGFLPLPIKKHSFFIGLYFNKVEILAKGKRFYNKARGQGFGESWKTSFACNKFVLVQIFLGPLGPLILFQLCPLSVNQLRWQSFIYRQAKGKY